VSDYFKENNSLLSLSIHTALRRPQIAATWALAARALDGIDASQAILPTGVGKTAVITALPLAIAASRALVIVPSNIIRRQIVHEFNTLKILKKSRAVPNTIPRANVKSLNHGIRSLQAWDDLGSYDVVIATPQCGNGTELLTP
jgi:reverse gyrase